MAKISPEEEEKRKKAIFDSMSSLLISPIPRYSSSYIVRRAIDKGKINQKELLKC